MERFGINNLIKKVSMEQFRDTAFNLEKSLKEIRSTISSKLTLTTNSSDYYGAGSLTVLTDESQEASNRREQIELSQLTQEIWDLAYERQFTIIDESSNNSYMICFSNEIEQPKRVTFYSQCLDENSNKIFQEFKQLKSQTQRLDDGFSKPSNYAIAHAMCNLNLK